jgi:hypothetical protein
VFLDRQALDILFLNLISENLRPSSEYFLNCGRNVPLDAGHCSQDQRADIKWALAGAKENTDIKNGFCKTKRSHIIYRQWLAPSISIR